MEGQERVIREAYQRAGGLNPNLTGYFECHGTGTPVGDPLEVEALARAMTGNRDWLDGPLLIGAVSEFAVYPPYNSHRSIINLIHRKIRSKQISDTVKLQVGWQR